MTFCCKFSLLFLFFKWRRAVMLRNRRNISETRRVSYEFTISTLHMKSQNIERYMWKAGWGIINGRMRLIKCSALWPALIMWIYRMTWWHQTWQGVFMVPLWWSSNMWKPAMRMDRPLYILLLLTDFCLYPQLTRGNHSTLYLSWIYVCDVDPA